MIDGSWEAVGGRWTQESRWREEVDCGLWEVDGERRMEKQADDGGGRRWIREGGWRGQRGGQRLTDGESREVGGRLTMEVEVNANGD